MRRPGFAVLCAACALAIGIPASIGLSADTQPSMPLSQMSKVERFGHAALEAQSAFLQRMPGVSVRYGDNGAISMLTGHTGIFLPSGLDGFEVGKPAEELLEKIGPALLAAGTEELRVLNVHRQAALARPESPERVVRLAQYIGGLEVLRCAVNIRINQETKEIMLVRADFLPDRSLQHEPKLTAAEARAKVEAAMTAGGLEKENRIIFTDTAARLAYAFEDIGDDGGIGGVLVWVFHATKGDGEEVEVSVSALTGEVIRTGSPAGLNRISYTANGSAPPSAFLPQGLVFTFGEGGTPPDAVADDAYDNAGIVHGVFQQALGRNSWNNLGSPI